MKMKLMSGCSVKLKNVQSGITFIALIQIGWTNKLLMLMEYGIVAHSFLYFMKPLYKCMYVIYTIVCYS